MGFAETAITSLVFAAFILAVRIWIQGNNILNQPEDQPSRGSSEEYLEQETGRPSEDLENSPQFVNAPSGIYVTSGIPSPPSLIDSINSL